MDEHVHDPDHCESCAKLRQIWTSWGFNEAVEMLVNHLEKNIKPEVRKLWRTLPINVRVPEVMRLAKEGDDKTS